MFDPSNTELMQASAKSLLRLALMVNAAEELQWEPSPASGHPRANDYADPVAETVADERRLAVRDAVEKARVTMYEVGQAAEKARRELEAMIDQWEGVSNSTQS